MHQLVTIAKPRLAAMLVTFETRTGMADAQPEFLHLGGGHLRPM
jgi:hypothetical protein